MADSVKTSARNALQTLRSPGHIVMLTGDDRTTAKAVAGEPGISDIMTEVLLT